MPSQHQMAVRTIVNDLLRQGDTKAVFLLEVAARMNDGFYPAWLVESVVQKHNGAAFDHFDAYCLLRILKHFYTGELFHGSIRGRRGPLGDRSKAENNATLATLPPRYRAEFLGGCGDDDGWFEWGEPIRLYSTRLNLDTNEETTVRVDVAPRRIPLEVGTTDATRSLLHLRRDGALARWPYGSGDLHILVLCPQALAALRSEDAPMHRPAPG